MSTVRLFFVILRELNLNFSSKSRFSKKNCGVFVVLLSYLRSLPSHSLSDCVGLLQGWELSAGLIEVTADCRQ